MSNNTSDDYEGNATAWIGVSVAAIFVGALFMCYCACSGAKKPDRETDDEDTSPAPDTNVQSGVFAMSTVSHSVYMTTSSASSNPNSTPLNLRNVGRYTSLHYVLQDYWRLQNESNERSLRMDEQPPSYASLFGT